MNVTVVGLGLVVALFVAILALLVVGRRLGSRRPPSSDADGSTGLGAIAGAVFALMGLLLAFSFSGALARWDARRAHIRDEVNAIGTAYLRLELLPETARPALKQKFGQYVDSRMATYDAISDLDSLGPARAKTSALQDDIWRLAVAASRDAGSQLPSMLVLESMNAMFDMAATRDRTAAAHPPLVVYLMLATAILMSSLLAGYDTARSKKVSRIHMVGFALMISATIYVTLEIEFPRVGLVRIDSADAAFVDLRATMK